jgi:chromosomal replication initiator protein
MPLVKWTLVNQVPYGLPKKMTVQELQDLICRVCKVEWSSLLVKNRDPKLVQARILYSYFRKRRFNNSLKDIGAVFNQDHSTIIHSIKCVTEHMQSKDPAWDQFKEYYTEIHSTIY